MSKFIPLHVHSHYSLLDGLPKIPDLVSFVKKNNMEAVALTDHGNMYGIVEFYKECTAQNIKPILGVETYVAPRKLTDKQVRLDDDQSHLILLARNLTGYKNLLKLVTLSHLQGFYYKPRVDKEALAQYHEGIVALSACLGGEIPQAILRGDMEGARQLAEWYRAMFGEGNFYLEVQAHPELPDQIKVNEQLRELSKQLSLPLVATNDSHYLLSEDQEAQDILVCIQTGKTVSDEKRLDMRGLDTSLKTEDQMKQDLPNYLDAIEQTGILAKELTVELEMGKRFFPSYPTPAGETPEAYLRLLTEQGLFKRFPTGITDEIRNRLEYELGIIMKKGYASYFLVVADFVNWARAQGIITTTRGSAAGSLVSYLIGITTINPLAYGLPFERFLNPERPSPPDIDMDFADNRRDEVIAYVTAKYGVDRVAQIVTFGTMAARAAVRDVGRALGYPYSLCDRIAKLIPVGSQGFHMTIARALEESAELKQIVDSDPQVKRLIELAQKVEGCVRHASVHAAGVVISPTPLADYTPLQYDVEGKHITTQYEMGSCEDVGLVKMDFLGIRNLSILGSAVKIIEKTKGIKINLETIPLNDHKTYELMARGETMGMFQLGGSGMTRYLKELKPSAITDIMAMVALFRPGPMNSIPDFIKRKHNPKLITYIDPRLKEVLNASYGIITYQDDVLLTAIVLAGYSWEEADKLRKAMGKKIVKEMARQKEKFISGCINHGQLSENKARELWSLIEPFAAYGFNKAHAASYAIVAYETAYLKANFTTEFMAALMTAEAGDAETIAQAVAESKRLGIEVMPPDINESLSNFTVVEDHKIRFGMNAIKNLGEQVSEAIINERKLNGPFTSLENFLARNAGKEITKKSLESLIKGGCLDSLHPERRQLIDAIETLLSFARDIARAKAAQQSSLFGGQTSGSQLKLSLPASPATTQQEKLTWEKELLGLYVTAHPFSNYATTLTSITTPINNLKNLSSDTSIVTAGLINQIKPITTKKGEAMCFATIEDLDGSIEIVCFPETYRTYKDKLLTDVVVAIRGRVTERNEQKSIIAQNIQIISTPSEAYEIIKAMAPSEKNYFSNNYNRPVNKPIPIESIIIKFPTAAAADIMTEFKKILANFPGTKPVVCLINHGGVWKKIATPFKINETEEFRLACQKLLGDDCFSS